MSGSDNSLTMPLAWHLPSSIDHRTQDRWQVGIQPIPCSVVKIKGELVEVKVEAQGKYTVPTLLVPQAFSEWIRQPTQVKDKGWLVPANYYLGGMSGEAGGVANYAPRGNLTTLVYMPISQKQFPKNTDRNLNAAFLNGPDGVVAQDQDGKYVVAAHKTPKPLHGKNGMVASEDGNVYIGPRPPTSKIVYLGAEIGGNGQLVGTYDWVMTASGPSINVKARVG